MISFRASSATSTLLILYIKFGKNAQDLRGNTNSYTMYVQCACVRVHETYNWDRPPGRITCDINSSWIFVCSFVAIIKFYCIVLIYTRFFKSSDGKAASFRNFDAHRRREERELVSSLTTACL